MRANEGAFLWLPLGGVVVSRRRSCQLGIEASFKCCDEDRHRRWKGHLRHEAPRGTADNLHRPCPNDKPLYGRIAAQYRSQVLSER